MPVYARLSVDDLPAFFEMNAANVRHTAIRADGPTAAVLAHPLRLDGPAAPQR